MPKEDGMMMKRWNTSVGTCQSVMIQQQHLLEKRINNPDDPLDIDELREDLALKYQKMNPKSMEADLDEDEEIGLFAGGFKGKCHKCGLVWTQEVAVLGTEWRQKRWQW